MTEPIVSEQVEAPSLMDVPEVLYAPSKVFARRRDGAFGMPLLIVFVLGLAVSLATMNLIMPALRADLARAAQVSIAAGKLTPELAAKGTAMQAKFAPIGFAIFYLVAPFVVGVVLWLSGLITRARIGVGVGIMIATFSLLPRIIGGIATAVFALLLPEESLTSMTKLSLSPAHFVDPVAHPALAPILARFEVFTIWSYVIIGIGVYVLARCTKAQAFATAVTAWLILSLPNLYTLLK
jgi:Yip1 domain